MNLLSAKRMLPTGSKSTSRWLVVSFSVLLVLSCGGVRPYRMMAQAAKSPERPAVFAHDMRLKASLRRAVVLAVPDSTLSVSPYVAGGHGYLVGWVKDGDQRRALEEAAQDVAGLLSLSMYLPVKPSGEEAPASTSELELKAKVAASIVAASGSEKINIAVDVLGSHAVLVGAVRSTHDIEAAVKAAGETSGISGVTDFLSVPAPGDEKRFGGFLP